MAEFLQYRVASGGFRRTAEAGTERVGHHVVGAGSEVVQTNLVAKFMTNDAQQVNPSDRPRV